MGGYTQDFEDEISLKSTLTAPTASHTEESNHLPAKKKKKKNETPGYDTKLHLIARLLFRRFGKCEVISLLALLFGAL